MPIWHFECNELTLESAAGIWMLASAIIQIAEFASSANITISCEHRDEEISSRRTTLLWESLSACIAFIIDIKIDKLPKWFDRQNISILISNSEIGNRELSAQEDIVSQNSCNVVIEYNREGQ